MADTNFLYSILGIDFSAWSLSVIISRLNFRLSLDWLLQYSAHWISINMDWASYIFHGPRKKTKHDINFQSFNVLITTLLRTCIYTYVYRIPIPSFGPKLETQTELHDRRQTRHERTNSLIQPVVEHPRSIGKRRKKKRNEEKSKSGQGSMFTNC